MAQFPQLKRLFILKNLPYPKTKEEILFLLKENGFPISGRTLERDFKIMRSLGLAIRYEYDTYRLHIEQSYNSLLLDRFRDSLLLKQSAALDFDLISSPPQPGLEFIPILAEAIDNKNEVHFRYKPYGKKETQYAAAPLTLKEYQGAWQILARVKEEYRQFSIDRMSNLKKDGAFESCPKDDNAIEDFKLRLGFTRPLAHLQGVEYPPYPNEKPDLIEVYLSEFLVPYWESKPIHHTQELVKGECKTFINPIKQSEPMTYYKVKFRLIPNYDLIKLLMAEVGDVILDKPEQLRDYISENFSSLVGHITEPSPSK